MVASAIAVAIPGGGHYYAGEEKRAAAIVSVVAAGAVLVGSAWRASDDCRAPACDRSGVERRNHVGMGIIAGAYLFSLVDAPLAVRRQNRARTAAAPPSGAGTPAANVVVTGDGAAGVALRLRF